MLHPGLAGMGEGGQGRQRELVAYQMNTQDCWCWLAKCMLNFDGKDV